MKSKASYLRVVAPPPAFSFKAYNASKDQRLKAAARVISKEMKKSKLTESQKELLQCLPLVFTSNTYFPHKSLQSTFEDMASKGYCDIFRAKKVVNGKLTEIYKVVLTSSNSTQKSEDKRVGR